MKPRTPVRTVLFAVVLGFSTTVAATAQADPYEDGFFAYHFSRDYATALRLWLPLAEQGDAGVQVNVGGMYDKGQGVTQDNIAAHMWFNLATAPGDEISRQERDRVAKMMTSAQIAEAQRLAREWKPKGK